DLETVESKIQKSEKLLKSNDKKTKLEYEVYTQLKKHLESGRLAKYFIDDFAKKTGGDISFLKQLSLLTSKHVLYVANVDDKNLQGNKYSDIVKEIAAKEGEL